MIIPIALLAASLASAQSPAPIGRPSVTQIKERFMSATDDPTRLKALDELETTRPTSAQDVSALFDLFTRYPDPALRKKVMSSLSLIDPSSPQLEPMFINYLRQPEPETQLFGINGAFRLRSRGALPLVRKIAERKFEGPDAAAISVLSQRNAWWTQYEALSVLAQWEHDKSLPLLRKKTDESAAVSRLLGEFYWRETFPNLKKWAESSDPNVIQKAVEAAGAQISPEDARATRDGMLDIVRDTKADPEVRHRLALKAGACSTDAEVEALIREHDKATEDKMRLLLVGAVAYSRSKKAAPLLARYALESPDEPTRKSARAELVELLGEAPAQALLDEQKSVKK